MMRDDKVREMLTGPVALGRRVNHDPRSRAFLAYRASERVPVLHRRWSPVLHQGNLGACTGFAAAHVINMWPLHRPGTAFLGAPNARAIYSEATKIDPFEGAWPPSDTGSDGLSVCKVLKRLGLITDYRWAFGFEHTLDALQLGPVLIGTTWHEGMFKPDSKGYVRPDGNPAGGHEYVLMGDDTKGKLTFLNSWGKAWGKLGRFHMDYDAFRALLADYGDAVVPERAA